MNRESSGRLAVPAAASIVSFCRFAREKGVPVGVHQTLAALEVARLLDIADRPTLALGLRATLCSCKDDWDRFRKIFEAFWNPARPGSTPSSQPAKDERFKINRLQASSRALMMISGEDCLPGDHGKTVSGASTQQCLQKVDLSDVPSDDIGALEQIALRLFRKMSLRLSRRLKIKNLADRVDIRRTIRRSIARGGEPIALAFKGKKPRNQRLVIFLDISGSMNSYSLFLVRFAYALQKHLRRINTFLFSTILVEITDLLRARDLPEALRCLSQKEGGWAGGTKIGESLREFNLRHAGKLLSRNTVFIILSDGWDTGDPALLAAELRFAKRRIRQLIWLNPLLGLKEYAPLTRGMSAAMPHVDVFAPAHNLESLLALEKYL